MWMPRCQAPVCGKSPPTMVRRCALRPPHQKTWVQPTERNHARRGRHCHFHCRLFVFHLLRLSHLLVLVCSLLGLVFGKSTWDIWCAPLSIQLSMICPSAPGHCRVSYRLFIRQRPDKARRFRLTDLHREPVSPDQVSSISPVSR